MNNANKFFISGYASVFNNQDDKGDIVLPSAFNPENINLNRIKFLYNHNQKAVIGKIEEVQKDSYGLFIKASIDADTSGLSQRVIKCISSRLLNGLSIGYIARQTQKDKTFNRRFIHSLDLREISVVQKPSNPKTTIIWQGIGR